MDIDSSPPKWQVIANFLCIYVVWGTTYFAIKEGIATIPPLFMASTRFFLAGPALLIIGKLRHEPFPVGRDFKIAALSGTLLVLANALVGVSELWLPSGTAAIIVGTIPLWILLLSWFFFSGRRPSLRQLFGIAMALAGILLLSGPSKSQGNGSLLGVSMLFIAVVSWSFGTLIQRKSGKLPNVFTFTGVQLISGAVAALLAAVIFEGVGSVHVAAVTRGSLLALLYLVVVGSIVGFSTYVWLNRNIEAGKVSTYALVNPMVAVWVGWLWGNEQLSSGFLFFTLLILVGLYLVIFEKPTTVAKS